MSILPKSLGLDLETLLRLEKYSQKTKTTTPSPATETPTSENSMLPVVSLAPLKKNKTALEQFEYASGGRESLADTLGLATLDKKQRHFLDLLTDPKRKRDTISTIARDSGLTALQVLDLFRTASFARAQAIAMGRMADSIPDVINDLTAKSVDAKVECPTCFGAKQLSNMDCPECLGKGQIFRPSDIDRQKIVFEAVGITKKNTGVNVQVNNQVNTISPGSFFSNYVRASDKAAYDISEAEILESDDEIPPQT